MGRKRTGEKRGRKSDFNTAQIAFLESYGERFQAGLDNGTLYSEVTQKWVETFGYTGFSENNKKGVKQSDLQLEDDITGLGEDEKAQVLKLRADAGHLIRLRIGNWFRHRYHARKEDKGGVEEILKLLLQISTSRPRKRSELNMYFDLAYKAKLKSTFDRMWHNGLQKIMPANHRINCVKKFTLENWLRESDEFRADIRKKCDEEFAVAMEAWNARTEWSARPSEYEAAITNLDAVLPPFADAISKYTGMVVIVTIVGLSGEQGGEVIVRSTQSVTAKDKVQQTWAQANTNGYQTFQKSLFNYGCSYFTEEERLARVIASDASGLDDVNDIDGGLEMTGDTDTLPPATAPHDMPRPNADPLPPVLSSSVLGLNATASDLVPRPSSSEPRLIEDTLLPLPSSSTCGLTLDADTQHAQPMPVLSTIAQPSLLTGFDPSSVSFSPGTHPDTTASLSLLSGIDPSFSFVPSTHQEPMFLNNSVPHGDVLATDGVQGASGLADWESFLLTLPDPSAIMGSSPALSSSFLGNIDVNTSLNTATSVAHINQSHTECLLSNNTSINQLPPSGSSSTLLVSNDINLSLNSAMPATHVNQPATECPQSQVSVDAELARGSCGKRKVVADENIDSTSQDAPKKRVRRTKTTAQVDSSRALVDGPRQRAVPQYLREQGYQAPKKGVQALTTGKASKAANQMGREDRERRGGKAGKTRKKA